MSGPRTRTPISRDQRLGDALLTNARVRAGTQVLVLVVWIIWVRSPWMAAFFLIRWVPIVTVLHARSLLPERGRVMAVAVSAAGQAVAALSTVALLPEFVPIAVLVMFGDLQLAKFLDRRGARQYLFGFVVVVAGVALLSLQSWTNLADAVPRVALVVIVVVHTAATGLVATHFGRESFQSLKYQAEELRRLGRRFYLAADEERERIGLALSNGAMNDLADLDRRLGRIDELLAADGAAASDAAAAAAVSAQQALSSLREFSHGVFPDALRQFGLRQALSSLVAGAPRVNEFEVVDQRFDDSVELALYGCAAEVVRYAAQVDADVSLRVWCNEADVLMSMTCEGPSVSASEFNDSTGQRNSADRTGAVGGEVQVQRSDAGLHLSAVVPAVPTDVEDRAALEAAEAGSFASSLLWRFNVGGVALSAFGVACATFAWVATGSRAAELVAAVLAVTLVSALASMRSVRRGRFVGTLAALSVITSVAALVMTAALPNFVPMTALLAVLPMSLVLPHLSIRSLSLIAGMQTATLAAVAVLALQSNWIFDANPLPRWVVWLMVPVSAAAVAALVAFTELMTHAEMSERTAAVRAALRRVVGAADTERRRVERDLHDGSQQHLVALAMQCRVLQRLATTDTDRAHALVASLRAQIGEARAELLDLVAGRLPEPVSQGRLADAVRLAASSSPVAVRVESSLDTEVSPTLAAQVYFCCREAIQNSVKHAGAGATVTVRLWRSDTALAFEVSDDGAGFEPGAVAMGSGLRSLRDRLEMAGGSLAIRSAEGEGTTLSGSVPW